MTKKTFISIVLFILLINTYVYALDYSFNARIIDSGNQKYKAIKLTPQIYNNTVENLADLEIFDEKKQPVPYFINSFYESQISENNIYEMELINSFVNDEDYYFDYAVKRLDTKDLFATSIEVEPDRNVFAVRLDVYGSNNNENWKLIQEDVLYNVDGNKKLEIVFKYTKKYTHYRIKIYNNIEKVSFSSVKLKYNKVLHKKEYFTETFMPDFSIEEKENSTVIKVRGLKNLKMCSLSLITPSMFKRNVTFDGRTSKMLYNLSFEKVEYKDLTLPMEPYKVTSDTSEIVIDNKDDRPIKVSTIVATYLADELVFESSGSAEYTLKFGNSEIYDPKSYDLSNYKEYILSEGYDLLSIEDVKGSPAKEPLSTKEPYDYKLIFNIAISIVAIVLGVIIFLKIKK